MAGRAKENLPGGSLKYLFVYLNIRILKCRYVYIYIRYIFPLILWQSLGSFPRISRFLQELLESQELIGWSAELCQLWQVLGLDFFGSQNGYWKQLLIKGLRNNKLGYQTATKYRIRVWGYSPLYIYITWTLYVVGTSNLGSWNGHWLNCFKWLFNGNRMDI